MSRYEGLPNFATAVIDFRRARNQAILKEILARFTGETTELLSYEEVRQKLKMTGSSERGLQDVPIDAIVGSVGRYTDFTRDFLPRRSVNEDRWARVLTASTSMTGLDPIDVYKIGEAYFVKDGNHRVSVARQLGAPSIQAYVTEIRTRVPLRPDVRPDDLILKAEYANFLERTHLDELRPEADLNVTIPGQYPVLEEHISVHRYFMGIDCEQEIDYLDAVADWYDTVYTPIIQLIREGGILREFPGRTEADLYLWIAEHRASLEKALGWTVRPETAIRSLVEQLDPHEPGLINRFGGILRTVLPLDKFEAGPPAGRWREETLATHRDNRLFTDLLVPCSGEPNGWSGLEQAILIAQREGAQLHGLHVVGAEAQIGASPAQAVRETFERRCREAGVTGHLVVAAGEVASAICERSRWVDLIVTDLAYPPPPQRLARLEHGFRDMIQRCPRPLLAVPHIVTPLSHALLAYDGSPKAEEALFVATYLAARWEIPVVVITVEDEGKAAPQTLERAQEYLLAHGVQATYRIENGPVAPAILKVAEEDACDLLLMGGYGYNPVLEVVLGSAVDQVLREANRPVFICR
jgi:nucleotide-binding universal stress UspA family protein